MLLSIRKKNLARKYQSYLTLLKDILQSGILPSEFGFEIYLIHLIYLISSNSFARALQENKVILAKLNLIENTIIS